MYWDDYKAFHFWPCNMVNYTDFQMLSASPALIRLPFFATLIVVMYAACVVLYVLYVVLHTLYVLSRLKSGIVCSVMFR